VRQGFKTPYTFFRLLNTIGSLWYVFMFMAGAVGIAGYVLKAVMDLPPITKIWSKYEKRHPKVLSTVGPGTFLFGYIAGISYAIFTESSPDK
jgi:hypothetical protein